MKTTKTSNLQRIIFLGLAAVVPLWPAAVVAAPPEREYEFQTFVVPAELGIETLL